MGYASLAPGPLGLLEASIILALVTIRIRRYPERAGGYLLGIAVVPLVLLGAIIARMPSCDVGQSARGECYAPITGPALIGYALAGLLGPALIALTVVRLRRRPPTATTATQAR